MAGLLTEDNSMSDGWSQDFNLKSVSEEVMNSIRDNIKMWDSALQKRNDELIKMRQEEVKRLEAERKKLMGNKQLRNMPEPKYCKCYYCPCMNGGDGGFVIDE